MFFSETILFRKIHFFRHPWKNDWFNNWYLYTNVFHRIDAWNLLTTLICTSLTEEKKSLLYFYHNVVGLFKFKYTRVAFCLRIFPLLSAIIILLLYVDYNDFHVLCIAVDRKETSRFHLQCFLRCISIEFVLTVVFLL